MPPAPAPPEPDAGPRSGPLTWDLFCRVIDNHGDLGVCWRLARDLASRGHRLRLWVDNAAALGWMAPQGHPGVLLRPWDPSDPDPDPDLPPGDVVIEAFGCELPPGRIARMAQREPPPTWINLEYLSAEDYVARSHGLPSPQWSGPGRGLTKWFFYPGYTEGTGGLLREPGLLARRDGFDRASFLHQRLGLTLRPSPPPGAARDEALVLLFGYAQPALPAWLDAFENTLLTLLVTPGYSARAVADWLGRVQTPLAGDSITRGNLRLHFLPHVSQDEFDHLLWSADWNLVRGEDSAVRALWAGRPFLWQLYVQDDEAQLIKLEAFCQVYLADAPPPLAQALRQALLHWNAPGRTSTPDGWQLWLTQREAWTEWAGARCRTWADRPDLVSALLGFVAQVRPDRPGQA